MDIYTLDSNFIKSEVIDGYESLIWTERYSEYGDFELLTSPTLKMRGFLKMGTMLSIEESDRIMIVESVYVTKIDGKNTLKASGRSFEAVLEDRAVRPGSYEWYVRSTTGDIVRDMVWRICVVGNAFSPNDVIPDLEAQNLSTSTKIIDTTVKFQSVYAAIKELCDAESLGFKITLHGGNPRLQFTVYSGDIRQGVVFSSKLDTLTNPSYLLSQESYKNIAYVYCKTGVYIVPAPGTDIDIQGVKRRVLAVDANDIDTTQVTAAEFQNMITQRGLEALAEHRLIKAFDGEIPLDAPYLYNRDYFQGDIVLLLGDNDATQAVRITEYIWAYDAEGGRSYPTFTEIE